MSNCLYCWNENNSCYKDFCSLICANKQKTKTNIDEYNKDPNICLWCWWWIIHIKWKLSETKRKKFCWISCSATFYNKPRKKIKVDYRIALREKIKEKWKNIIENWLFEPNMSQKEVKKYYIEKRWDRCEECWVEDWNNKPITIELHHIDWDCTNQSDENIILLCPNCHSQTDTYKSKNKNSKRRR